MAIVTKAVVGKNACSETGLSPKDAAILVEACFEAIQATLESEEEGWPRRCDVDLDLPGTPGCRPQPATVLRDPSGQNAVRRVGDGAGVGPDRTAGHGAGNGVQFDRYRSFDGFDRFIGFEVILPWRS